MKHQAILSKLTLAEKCSLLSGVDFWHTPAIAHAAVPALRMSDGPHGLRLQRGATDNLGVNGSVPATCFPTACALASSWDTALTAQVGAALGKEAAAAGVGMLLGPGLCLKRDPLCGRNFEYFSEDPLLAGKQAAAMIQGVQSVGVAACPKHFAVNNQETRRLTVDAVVDERTLRELYLFGFETAVREGNPRAIMSAYNRINGVYASENRALLTDILRDDWGFSGAVVTDWGAGNDRVAQLRAGGNLEMPGTCGETDREVLQAMQAGELDEATLDARLDELLDTILSAQDGVDKAQPVDFDAHHALARQAAASSMVLLKNEAGLLPLKRGARVAVIGDFGKTPRYQGAGSSLVNPTQLHDYHALEAAGLTVAGYAQGFRRYGGKSGRLQKEACALAKQADTVLLYLGLDEYSEAEGVDRTHMRLPENQIALLAALHAIHPNIVVLLACGSPVEMEWEPQAAAILHCNLGGQAIAEAIADVLTGQVNPSGKLAESYPYRYDDAPTCGVFPGGAVTTEYREGLYVGYRYYLSAGVPVRYPFGYGLSYTTFALSDLTYASNMASLVVTNTGTRAGAEVVQVYVEAQTKGVYRPKRVLAGFLKITLAAGASAAIQIPLSARAFQYWDTDDHAWRTEAGDYCVYAGTSCADTPLCAKITLQGAPPKPGDDSILAYSQADVKHVSDAAFVALLGRALPIRTIDPARPLNMNDTVEDGAAHKGFARFLCGLIKFLQRTCRFFGKRNEALYLGVALQMPYRSLWRVTNGMFTREMLDGFLLMVNHHFFRGLRQVMAGNRRKKSLCKPMDEKAGVLS